MRFISLFIAMFFLLLSPVKARHDWLVVTIHKITDNGIGARIGTIRIRDSEAGLVLRPDLNDLPPGPHGFHVHQNPSCAPGERQGKMAAGLEAGGHYDPIKTGLHRGPHNKAGHLGDLPLLIASPSGRSAQVLIAPRLTVAGVRGRSLMIHANGDTFSDTPKPLGGGGARIACGVIQ